MKYYVLVNGQQIGPVEESQLLSMGVTRETQMWREGMAQWQAAGTIPELGYLFASSGGYTAAGGYGSAGNAGNAMYPCPKTYLVESILVTIFCCVPFGIVSIVNAAAVSSAYSAGNYQLAVQKSENAKKWALISLACGIVGFVIGFIAGLLG